MRYIFVDEAGISQSETVSVVVGIIADADQHVMSAETLALEVLRGIPPKFLGEFVFSAKSLLHDKHYRDGWSLNERLGLLCRMMQIPQMIGMAISVGVQYRGALKADNFTCRTLGISPWQAEHMQAFYLCIAQADKFIRKHGSPREIGAVVAEDHQEMRKFLKVAPAIIRQKPVYVTEKRTTIQDQEAGFSTQDGDIRVTRIRNSVHFVEKSEDILIQVADACAYGIRRCLAGQEHGTMFSNAIFGRENALRNFAFPGGAEFYRWV